MQHERPSAEQTFLRIAYDLSLRSTCQRAAVGAIVVSSDGLQILGIGYNGAPSGVEHCTSHSPGECGCIHAELNAILKAPGTMPGMTLYTTHSPCLACAKLILNTGVERIVYHHQYRDDAGLRLLIRRGIVVVELDTIGPPIPRSIKFVMSDL